MPRARDSSKRDILGPIFDDLHAEEHDFSLVTGGPLYQFLRKARLSGAGLEHLYRRVAVITLVAWVPLLLLAEAEKSGFVSFLEDFEAQARFLVALPILIAGEVAVQSWTRGTVRAFLRRRLVPDNDVPRFDRAIASALRVRDSTLIQIAIVILVYTVGLWLWANRVPLTAETWYALPGGRWRLTPAGYWYAFVSIPIVQILLLGWYVRFFVWCRFLWQVSKIKLNLIATHPDHRAGLGFLGRSAYAFAPILFAQGAMLAGVVASRVLYRGETLVSFRLQIIGFVTLFLLAVVGPLLVFSPQLVAAKRKGLGLYGSLGQDYVEKFERKWVGGDPARYEELLGTGDLQSLADLSNSYSIVSSMRMVPFGLDDVVRLAVTTAIPFLPLLLTMFNLEELVLRLLKLIF